MILLKYLKKRLKINNKFTLDDKVIPYDYNGDEQCKIERIEICKGPKFEIKYGITGYIGSFREEELKLIKDDDK